MATVKMDPVTRIEGHLGVTMETKDITTSTGTWTVVDKAYSHTNLFRGWEIILKGRDPRDAFFLTQRICGVCPAPHGETAIQALDHAYGMTPPPAAILARNILHGAYYVYDHMIHTYLLIGPELGVLAKYPPMVPPALGKDGIKALGLGSSYAACIQMQRKANKVVALWGGKFPHHTSEYPSGMTVKPTLDRIANTISNMTELWDFVVNVMVPDFMAIVSKNDHIAETVSTLLDIDFNGLQDLGPTYGNFLSYGLFPDYNDYDKWVAVQDGEEGYRDNALIKAGAWDGDFKKFTHTKIKEYVKYSRYDDSITGRHPSQGDVKVVKDKPGAYGWMKAPRYEDKVYEVGPLARMINTYGLNWKIDVTNPVTGESFTFKWKVLNPKGSVVDRVAARVAQTVLFATKTMEWAVELKQFMHDDIVNAKIPDYSYVPDNAEGMGLWDAPRGALLHYTKIRNKKIDHYQCIVPSTWNLGPRDDMGQPGPVEKALEGTWLPKLDVPTVANALYPEKDIDASAFGLGTVSWGDALAAALTPLGLAQLNMEEGGYNTSLAITVVRSFDPCIACGVHFIIK
jgi:hydrogenase large subunit